MFKELEAVDLDYCFFKSRSDVQVVEMEESEGVFATERYGSQESWKYLLKEGKVKRQRDAVNGGLAANSVSGVFKVREEKKKMSF